MQNSTEQTQNQSSNDWQNHEFVQPQKMIKDQTDLELFKKSPFVQEYLQFIMEIQKSIESKPISATQQNPKFEKIVEFLNKLENLVDEVPPIQQPMRFGNKAFRTWHEKMSEGAVQFLDSLLEDINLKKASVELLTYLKDSFGSSDRIDYGTGHEMNFFLFLYCLHKIGLYDKQDYESLTRNLFNKYIKLMRKIQTTYMLEPAGSHGVWGIDDYQFLPFVLGASELIKNNDVKVPDDIHNNMLLNEFADEYMYLGAIQFIKNQKKGIPFHECSPILNDISGVPTWNKVAQGLIKMYQADVLFKLPVAKHIYFGSILKFK